MIKRSAHLRFAVRPLIALAVTGLVGTPVLHAEVVWLLQTGNSNPNGTGVYQNGGLDSGGGAILPVRLENTTSNVLQLSHGSMGVSAYTQYGLKTSNMYASAWTPGGFFAGDPLAPGDLVGHASVPMPTITEVGFGLIFGFPISNYMASWDTPGSLLGLNLILQPGQVAYFSIAVQGQGNLPGYWMSRESSLQATSDTLWSSASGYQSFVNISWTQYDGRLEGNWAFVPVFRKGDVNCDGARNVLDVASFVEALIDPAAYAKSFPDCDLQSADMNNDGRVDGMDIVGFVNCIPGGACP